MASSIQQFSVEHERAIAHGLAVVSCLAALASVALACLAPEFRQMSLIAAGLSLLVGVSWWRVARRGIAPHQ